MIKWVIKFWKINPKVLAAVGVLLLLLQSPLVAQRFSSEYWHEGTVILLSGEKLTGKIKYDFQKDLIQYSSPKGINTAYTSLDYLFFEINDAYQEKIRRFYSLPFHPEQGYETPRMFEVLAEGELNLLAREEIEISNRNYGYSPYRLPSQEDLIISYYILKKGSKIKIFRGKKAELMAYMGKRSDQVQKYMKAENLQVNNKRELLRIIAYYNSLVSTL